MTEPSPVWECRTLMEYRFYGSVRPLVQTDKEVDVAWRLGLAAAATTVYPPAASLALVTELLRAGVTIQELQQSYEKEGWRGWQVLLPALGYQRERAFGSDSLEHVMKMLTARTY